MFKDVHGESFSYEDLKRLKKRGCFTDPRGQEVDVDFEMRDPESYISPENMDKFTRVLNGLTAEQLQEVENT